MSKFAPKPVGPPASQRRSRQRPDAAGNVLVYVVVLMLIFGALGVAMVSLFSTSTASTVTRNDTRRARYLSESGVRYAVSEMRKADFEEDTIIDPLNTLTYTVSDAGTFELNIFSPWFESVADIDSPDVISLSPYLGLLPADFTASAVNGVWVVNFEYVTGTGPDILTVRDEVISYSIDDVSGNLNVDIKASFVAQEGDEVALAVQPTAAQGPLAEGDDLLVVRDARLFFPPFNGAINIDRVDYAYERLVDDPINNRVILQNLTASQFPNTLAAFPLNVTTGISGDFVVLTPHRNYMVMAEGTSDEVSYGNTYALGMNVYDASVIRPAARKPDITADDLTTSLSQQETDTRFFEPDQVADTLTIGGGGTDEFGSAFFSADLDIGGERDFCQQGACLFGLGVRAFFLMDFSSQGDGLTFTLISGANNRASSAGGDVDLSELMGYAGDSRTNSSGTSFLATAPEDRGLDPPKIAVEFDTRTNNRADDPPPDYCVGANAETNLRNDPLAGNKDAVQYVFWGRRNFLNIPCRGNNPLYDDNRHDADGEAATEEWRFSAGGNLSLWRPAIGPDGTIYASDRVSTLYALNKDGSIKWTFNLTDGNDYMPGVDPITGTIYSDIFANSIIAIDPDGNELWRFDAASDIDSTPTVGPDGRVYFGTDAAQSLFAIDPAARAAGQPFPQLGEWQFPTGGEIDTVPVLSPDGTTVYFVANDNTLYALKMAAREADPTGAGGINGLLGEWTFPIDTDPGEVNSSPTVNPSDGTIYVGSSDDHSTFAINPDGTLKWQFNPGTGRDMESSPTLAIDPIDGNPTVYIGSDDGNVYAINANSGAEKWRFDTGSQVVSSPIVDLDGTIYVGSDNGNVYAINPNGTQKWLFPTGGLVRSSPAIGQDGFIHIGSNDTNFYTISQYGNPRNFKDENKSAGKLLTVEDLDPSVLVDSAVNWLNGAASRGPWAVRLEVDRSTILPGLEGFYELRLWMKQCINAACDNINTADDPFPTDDPFFKDTRVVYQLSPPDMVQFFQLDAAEQAEFDRFLFGFTAAAGAQALNVTLANFALSFIRPGDPIIDIPEF